MSRTKTIQRDRSQLELEVLHVEISKESKDLLKELAAARGMPVGGYVDVMVKQKRAKLKRLGFIQS